MGKYKKLFNNSLIFSIGNLGNKFILFLMVPIYTHFLTKSEYGLTDVVTVTINLLIPILTLSISQAVLRFCLDKSNYIGKDDIYSIVATFLLSISIVIFFISIFINKENLFYIVLILILMIFNDFQLQFARGIDLIKQYAINGIFTAVSTALLGVYFLSILHLNLKGYFLSIIITLLLSNIYLFLATSGLKYFNYKKISFNKFCYLLKYSIPLIPNSIMWWLINDITRYFILYNVGFEGNGLFAVASKIPSIMSIMISIFMQAWQISAFEEYKRNNSSIFYSRVFNVFISFIFIISSLILISSRGIFSIFIDHSFYEGYKLVPILIFASIYQGFSTFFGTIYTASMNTKGVFYSSICGALISLVLNIILIPKFGINGAGFGIGIAFFMTWLIRYFNTKTILKININMKYFIVINILFILQCCIVSFLDDSKLEWYECLLTIPIIVLCIFNIIKSLKKKYLE